MLSHYINFLLNSSTTIFWVAALIGTTIFFFRMLLSFAGGMIDADDFDMDMLDGADGAHHHQDASFKIFTFHSLSAFLMMFGWAGLAGVHQLGLTSDQSLLLAFGVGSCMLVVTALIMRGALMLEGAGNVFSLHKTVGHVATVYQRIPTQGQGKIHIVIDNISREILAQSQEGTVYESFTLVQVVKVLDHEIVEVIAYKRNTSC